MTSFEPYVPSVYREGGYNNNDDDDNNNNSNNSVVVVAVVSNVILSLGINGHIFFPWKEKEQEDKFREWQ